MRGLAFGSCEKCGGELKDAREHFRHATRQDAMF